MKHLIATVVVALGLVLGSHAVVADERPSEIPYDQPGEFPQLSPDYKMHSHRVVLITDQAINPRLVTLEEGQLVAWISYSSSASTVVFEREVARDMICHSLVNFKIVDDELRSAPIHAGEFASFCQLKPGRYDYKIVREQSIEHEDARRRLKGVIVVGDPK